jgi:purine-binding chemotaxis protein CheW
LLLAAFVCAPRQTKYRDRHAKNICFAFVLNLANHSITVTDAQGVMLDLLTNRATEVSSVFVVMVGARTCAFPLHHVAESMRPLPIMPVAGTPGFVRGLSVIRGTPMPVIDLKALLDNSENCPSYGRFVTLKWDDQRVVIGVDSVVGLRNLDATHLAALPSLLRQVNADLIESIGTRDAQLLLVLRAARIVPDEVWTTLAAAEATP